MKFPSATVHARFPSPLGTIITAATSKGLAGLWFDDQRHLPLELTGPMVWPMDLQHPLLKKVGRQLNDYFAGRQNTFDLPLDLAYGTVFQQSVWHALLKIPFGDTISYGEVSARIGRPAAVRAVGSAIGRNPIGIIVPCHRVLAADGALAGYAGGLERKSALLALEKKA